MHDCRDQVADVRYDECLVHHLLWWEVQFLEQQVQNGHEEDPREFFYILVLGKGETAEIVRRVICLKPRRGRHE